MMKLSLALFFLFGIVTASSSPTPGLRGGRVLRETTRELQGSTTTTNYTVIDDTFIRDSKPTTNYNYTTNLGVKYGTDNRISFIKFPIPFELQGATSIDSAKVHLRINQAPLVSMDVHVFPCDTENWSESVITWNNSPSFDNTAGALIASFTLIPSDAGAWVEFDVTSPVVAAAQAQQNSLSLVLKAGVIPVDNNPATERIKFDSKEDTVDVPHMSVTYEPSSGSATASPTPAPTMTPTIDFSQPEYPQLVSEGADGSLEYVQYANEINHAMGSTANAAAVNTVPDFSGAGYKGGGVPIPFVPVTQTVSAERSTRKGCALFFCLISERPHPCLFPAAFPHFWRSPC